MIDQGPHVLQHVLTRLRHGNNYLMIFYSFTFLLTYKCQDERVQHRDYGRRLPYMKEGCQIDELEDWRVQGLVEWELHLYRKLPRFFAGRDYTMTQVAAHKVEDSGQTI